MFSFAKESLGEVAEAFGFHEADMEYLGEGSYGTVFSTPDPTKVIKISSSEEDGRYAKKMLGLDLEYSANIHRYITLRNRGAFGELTLYGILMERVDVSGVEKLVVKHFSYQEMSGTTIYYGPRARNYIKRFIETCVFVAAKELEANGLEARDAHPGNVGIKNGHYCLFDQLAAYS